MDIDIVRIISGSALTLHIIICISKKQVMKHTKNMTNKECFYNCFFD